MSAYAEKNHLQDGNTIVAVTGRLVKLYEPKEMTGQYGPYTLQGGKIEVDGETLALTIYGSPLPKGAYGKVVTFKSGQTEKGVNGVKFKIKRYENKAGETVIEDAIEVGKNGEVYFGDKPWLGGPIPTGNSQVSEAPKTAPKPQTKAAQQSDGEETLEGLLRSLLGVHEVCHKLILETYPGEPEESKRTYTASLFIEANKSGARHLKHEPVLPKRTPLQFVGPHEEEIPF